MPDLDFKIEKAAAVPYSASPLLSFTLQIANNSPRAAEQHIHTVALRCQIRIEPEKRQYQPLEKERLSDLFGPPSRWGQTLRPMLWTHTSIIVPAFIADTTVELPVPCTYDFNLAATRFFHALDTAEVPLNLLFSGTIFQSTGDAPMQIAQISWQKEAHYKLPIQVWKDMMQLYYPNCAWLNLHADTFNALAHFKSENSLPTWEAAIEALLRTRNVSEAPIGTRSVSEGPIRTRSVSEGAR